MRGATPRKSLPWVPITLKYVNMADVNSPMHKVQALHSPAGAPLGKPAGDDARLVAMVELLFFAYRDFVAGPDEILAELGFGRAHHRVLHFVNQNPGLRVADLLGLSQLLEPLMLLVPECDDVVVVMDGNLLTYAHQLSKAVAQALPFGADEYGAGEPDLGRWPVGREVPARAVRRFNELMLAVMTGNSSLARPYLPEPAYETIATELCDCMELFIVSREYARLVDRDHLKASTEARAVCGERFQALRWSSEQEMRADGLGLALTLTAAAERGDSLSWAFFAVDALLASFGIIERSLPILTQPAGSPLLPDVGAAHDARRGLIRDVLRQWEGGERVIAFADAMVPLLAQLGDHFEAVLYDLRWQPRSVN